MARKSRTRKVDPMRVAGSKYRGRHDPLATPISAHVRILHRLHMKGKPSLRTREKPMERSQAEWDHANHKLQKRLTSEGVILRKQMQDLRRTQSDWPGWKVIDRLNQVNERLREMRRQELMRKAQDGPILPEDL